MYEFIKFQYLRGNISKEKVLSYVSKWITAEEAQEIIKGEDV